MESCLSNHYNILIALSVWKMTESCSLLLIWYAWEGFVTVYNWRMDCNDILLKESRVTYTKKQLLAVRCELKSLVVWEARCRQVTNRLCHQFAYIAFFVVSSKILCLRIASRCFQIVFLLSTTEVQTINSRTIPCMSLTDFTLVERKIFGIYTKGQREHFWIKSSRDATV